MTKEEKDREYKKQYYLDNKEKIKSKAKQYHLDNKEKVNERQKQYYLDNKERRTEYFLDNKERRTEYHIQYYQDNKEKIKAYDKQYHLDNKEKIKAYDKQRYQDNKEKINEQKKQYLNERYNSDPLFKFTKICRSRTFKAFKSKSWIKNGGTEKLLGCDWETAFNHIEKQFESWMTWENHGEWHIDHIIPLASANTIEEMTPLFNYKNLQPLLAEDNILKGDKIL